MRLFTLALVVSASTLLAQARLAPRQEPSPKKPWQFTLEERIALRTNPELARERVRGAQQEKRIAASAASETRPPVDSYTGKTHPELFLPHEVYRSLMALAFEGPATSSERVRKGLMPEVRRVGLPEDFWERLRALSAVYLADVTVEQDLGASLGRQSGLARERVREALEVRQDDVCRSRADAIAAARKEFGSETFDRFLYEVIAVNKFHSETELPSPQILRWVEAGCR